MFKHYCTPAKIYLFIAIIYAICQIFYLPVTFVIINLIFAVIWTCILGWLCNKGYSSVAWFLVLFPYVVILINALGTNFNILYPISKQ